MSVDGADGTALGSQTAAERPDDDLPDFDTAYWAERIERGLADVEAGRTVPHAEAMTRLDAVIEDVQDEPLDDRPSD